MKIDFRSDTVTKPTAEMREAMWAAEIGDDVFGEDPTVNRLEQFAAELFAMEAAIFCPSGTMTNQIAIKCHTQPGDEVICEESSHVYQYEGGGIAFNSGASVKLIVGNRGRINAEQVRDAIQPDDAHRPRTSLVSLENTCNRGGGSCYDLAEIKRIRELCIERGLALHLDGARLWNALVEKQQTAREHGDVFDSISVCLSKGLGCPVGSLLIGKRDFIKRARRIRKVFGGGMRQAGSLAAAGLYALQHHLARLATDHQRARQIESVLQQRPHVKQVLPVETNIVIFELKDGLSASECVKQLSSENIFSYAITPSRVRLVVHLDIDESMMERALDVFHRI
jgi:threonine aldolase